MNWDYAPEEDPALTREQLETTPGPDALQEILDTNHPSNLPPSLRSELIATAWEWLEADLHAARWSEVEVRAATAAAPGVEDGARAGLVTVELWVSGRNTAGTDVEISTWEVRVGQDGNGQWRVLGLNDDPAS